MARLKCDPRRLPKPMLSPTRDVGRRNETVEIPYEYELTVKTWHRPHPAKGRSKYTPGMDATIQSMRADGKTFREIGDEIGVSESAARNRLQRINLEKK